MKKYAALFLALSLVAIISGFACANEWSESVYGTWTHEGTTIDITTWKDVPIKQIYVFNEDGTYTYQVIEAGNNRGKADGTFTFDQNGVKLNQLNGGYVVHELKSGFDDAGQSVLIVAEDNYYYHTGSVVEETSKGSLERLLTSTVSTENARFTLHGGVYFDMTANEMIAREKDNGLEPKRITDGKLTLATEWGAGHSYDLSQYSAVYEVAGSFVADSFPTLYYFFDKEDKLCQMIYCGTSCYSTAEHIANINYALADLYKDKYGEYDTKAMDFSKVTDMQNLPELKIEDDGFIIYELSLTDSSYQWLYPCDAEHFVDIEIQGLKWVMKGRGQSEEYPAYSTVVGYTRVAYEDVSDTLQKQQDKVIQTMDDI